MLAASRYLARGGSIHETARALPESASPAEASSVAASDGDGVESDGVESESPAVEWGDEAASAHSTRTALQVAAAEGSETVLEFLLQVRQPVRGVARDSRTLGVVGKPCAVGELTALSRSPDVADAPLARTAQNAAEVDTADGAGKTALHLAVEANEGACVAQLLARGANISAPDAKGVTPMSTAAELELDDVLQVPGSTSFACAPQASARAHQMRIRASP